MHNVSVYRLYTVQLNNRQKRVPHQKQIFKTIQVVPNSSLSAIKERVKNNLTVLRTGFWNTDTYEIWLQKPVLKTY